MPKGEGLIQSCINYTKGAGLIQNCMNYAKGAGLNMRAFCNIEQVCVSLCMFTTEYQFHMLLHCPVTCAGQWPLLCLCRVALIFNFFSFECSGFQSSNTEADKQSVKVKSHREVISGRLKCEVKP